MNARVDKWRCPRVARSFDQARVLISLDKARIRMDAGGGEVTLTTFKKALRVVKKKTDCADQGGAIQRIILNFAGLTLQEVAFLLNVGDFGGNELFSLLFADEDPGSERKK